MAPIPYKDLDPVASALSNSVQLETLIRCENPLPIVSVRPVASPLPSYRVSLYDTIPPRNGSSEARTQGRELAFFTVTRASERSNFPEARIHATKPQQIISIEDVRAFYAGLYGITNVLKNDDEAFILRGSDDESTRFIRANQTELNLLYTKTGNYFVARPNQRK